MSTENKVNTPVSDESQEENQPKFLTKIMTVFSVIIAVLLVSGLFLYNFPINPPNSQQHSEEVKDTEVVDESLSVMSKSIIKRPCLILYSTITDEVVDIAKELKCDFNKVPSIAHTTACNIETKECIIL